MSILFSRRFALPATVTLTALLLSAANPVLAGGGHKHGHGHDDHGHGKHSHGAKDWKDKGHAYGHYKHKSKWRPGSVVVPVAAVAATAVAVPVVVGAVTPPAPATVVYPPWIVVQDQRPVYRPGQAPTAPVQRSSVFQCNSKTVGQVLGGITGAVIGNQIGEGSGRAVATVGGAIVGVLVGGEIGRQIDARDQACIGQALEFSPGGKRIEWTGAAAPQQYAVVPGSIERHGSGEYCRRYEVEVRTPSGWQKTPGLACRQADGVWLASR